jgi:hypothetical protein
MSDSQPMGCGQILTLSGFRHYDWTLTLDISDILIGWTPKCRDLLRTGGTLEINYLTFVVKLQSKSQLIDLNLRGPEIANSNLFIILDEAAQYVILLTLHLL